MKTDLVLNIRPLMLRRQQIRNLPALRRNRLRANLGRLAFGDTVKDPRELVVRVLADSLRAVRVIVVESFRRTKSFDEREIARAASRDDLAAGENGELNGQTAGRGAAAVDEDGVVRFLSTWQRESQTLVKALSDSCHAHAERAGVFV